MKFLNLFKQRKIWKENHIFFWQNFLEFDSFGFSVFQNELLHKIEQLLTNQNVTYSKEITKHQDTNDTDKNVKLIHIKTDIDSTFWIYHDMAEFSIKGNHQMFEEWGYLKPQDLITNFMNSIKTLLTI
jgi:hypothetical protein